MPIPHLPPIAQATAVILGVALAIVRLLTASRPFWNFLPNKLQKALPAAAVALGLLPAALENAKSWLDVATAAILVVGTYFTGSRGDQRPPIDKDGGPRQDRANTDPKLTRDELDPPISIRPPGGMDAECSALPAWAFTSIAIAVLLVGCAATKRLPCDESKLTAIDTAYLAKVGKACLRYASASQCPDLPELRAEHSRQLREACLQ